MRLAALLLALVPSAGDDAAAPQGEPVLDPPTLRSLGVSWVVKGDANRNAKVAVEYRKPGAAAWKVGPPLFRVEKGLPKDLPEGWLFAGSLVLLEPGTAYEIRLKLSDPDGGSVEKILKASTISEPSAPASAPLRHVAPGSGGGSGTAADPFKGIAEAESRAKPGDVFLVHAGAYPGVFTVKKSGEPGKPIVWRGAGDGDVVIGGADAAPEGIRAEGVHDVWFERLVVRNKDYGLLAHEAAGLVIRRCRFEKVKNGIYNGRNTKDAVRGWWISDNVLEGVSPWPRPGDKLDENEWRGIQITGEGHVIAWNRVHQFKDAIDTFPSGRCAAIDIHNNDLSELNDDGIELDFSQRNVRCFENRIVNTHCAISTQPVLGGPAYVFRNVMFNSVNEPFKMHSDPSGVLFYHNTSVRQGMALQLFTPAHVRNCVMRNNLFVGTTGPFAYESTAKMVDCDFDYDGFAGGPWKMFLKWNEVRYAAFEDLKAKAPVYRHAVRIDAATLFAGAVAVPANPLRPVERAVDLRLKPGSAAIDAGEPLPGFNDGFVGKGPDLGATELGQELPLYGPRPEKK
ncbi:MAG TPA: right-handed parallel beta-helix repeat-containing protein [Planctomycetota bacterium]|nr:right-handed parallel beta-helix repeat-containing protein [Planctomycetota bacterium]